LKAKAGLEFGAKTIRVSEGVAQLLRDLIHSRTGLFFENSRMDFLIEKLEPAAQARGFGSFLEYYYALRDNDRGEWDRAWDALSVQETYFWREMAQINALVGTLVPQWFKTRSMPFRIWSAACASGEEPYTVAMALDQGGWRHHPIEIAASDASLLALHKAERGIYRENSFRALPAALRKRYFQQIPEGWRLSDEIKNRVSFRRANLLEPGDVASLARVQVILCRNVFIYFSRHAIRQTVAMMAAKMAPGGHLFVGASESLLKMTTDFELREIGDALAYVRI
jgi:chemotaxis protein methyltransferase CheR